MGNNSPREILIVHTWGIGDMIMLTPALRAAKKLHPELKISLLVTQPGAAKPVLGAPYVESVIYAGNKPRHLFPAIPRLRRKRYHAVLFSTGVSPLKAWLLLLLARAERKLGEYRSFKLPFLTDSHPYNDAISRPRANYELLGRILELPPWEEALKRAEELDLRTDFQLRDENRDWAEQFIRKHQLEDKPLLGLHPGSMAKFRFKRWPREYFAELIGMLGEAFDCRVVVIAGPDEIEEGDFLRDKAGSLLLEPSSLANTAAFIARCQAFVNTDSGLGHIASCFQIPGLTIVGPGDEKQTAPFSPHSKVIRRDLPCAPCIRQKKRSCALECLRELTPDLVFAKLSRILDAAGFPRLSS